MAPAAAPRPRRGAKDPGGLQPQGVWYGAAVVVMLSKILRIPGLRGLWQRFPVGSAEVRAQHDIWRDRPHYGFGVWEGARLARWLDLSRISVAEVGVAGGAGLLALERIAEEVQADLGVQIDVVGFDTGQGMPPPQDYRDIPHFWGTGFYRMDEAGLRAKLRRAKLLLGDVRETIPQFLRSTHSSLAFVAFDVDYYSSTSAALRLLEGPPETHLPRVLCYFDNVIFPFEALLNEHVGEELAIREFNERHLGDRHDFRQVTRVRGLSFLKNYRAFWHEQMYCLHHFSHPLYTVSVHPKVVRARAAAGTPATSAATPAGS